MKHQPKNSPIETSKESLTTMPHIVDHKALEVINSLGGIDNILSAKTCALSRIRIELAKATKPDRNELQKSGINDIMFCDNNIIHLLVNEQTAISWEHSINNYLTKAIA